MIYLSRGSCPLRARRSGDTGATKLLSKYCLPGLIGRSLPVVGTSCVQEEVGLSTLVSTRLLPPGSLVFASFVHFAVIFLFRLLPLSFRITATRGIPKPRGLLRGMGEGKSKRRFIGASQAAPASGSSFSFFSSFSSSSCWRFEVKRGERLRVKALPSLPPKDITGTGRGGGLFIVFFPSGTWNSLPPSACSLLSSGKSNCLVRLTRAETNVGVRGDSRGDRRGAFWDGQLTFNAAGLESLFIFPLIVLRFLLEVLERYFVLLEGARGAAIWELRDSKTLPGIVFYLNVFSHSLDTKCSRHIRFSCNYLSKQMLTEQRMDAYICKSLGERRSHNIRMKISRNCFASIFFLRILTREIKLNTVMAWEVLCSMGEDTFLLLGDLREAIAGPVARARIMILRVRRCSS